MKFWTSCYQVRKLLLKAASNHRHLELLKYQVLISVCMGLELGSVFSWSGLINRSDISDTTHFYYTSLSHPIYLFYQFIQELIKIVKSVSNHQRRVAKGFLHSFDVEKHVLLLLTWLHCYFLVDLFGTWCDEHIGSYQPIVGSGVLTLDPVNPACFYSFSCVVL